MLKRRNDGEVLLDKRLLAYNNTLSLNKKASPENRNTEEEGNYLIVVLSTSPVAISKLIASNYEKSKLSVYDSQQKLRAFMDKDREQFFT